MTTEQITEYLNKYRIISKELLAEHILQLKRNTKPNVRLISNLVWVLEDSSFLIFFPPKIEVKDDVITNVNRGEKEVMEWFNESKLLSCCIKKEDCHCNRNKEEKLVFTTLEKELTSQKQQGHLSTRHKKPASMYLDEFLSEENYKNSQQKIVDDWNKGDGLTIGIKDSQKELKAPIFTYCKVNKNALEALALRALYGHQKYNKNGADEDWQNFTRVDNGDFEYANAQFRHALEIGGEETEEEHLISSAWNAVSRLQIYLKNK